MYFNKEEADRRIDTKIKDMRTIAGLFPAIAKTARRFNGKVYNKRFIDALREETGARIFAHKRSDRYIYFYTFDSFNDYKTIAQLVIDEMPDGKRIDADAFIASLREYRETYLQEARSYELYKTQAPMIKSYIDELIAKIASVSKDMPYEIKEMYDFPKLFR